MKRYPSCESTFPRICIVLGVALIASFSLGGCAVGHLIGGMLQNEEYQKQVQTLPMYAELEGKRVAVLVDADMDVLYQHPKLVEQVTTGITLRIGRDVKDVQVRRPSEVLAWQWQTPQWNALPYGDIVKRLDVDRVIFIDIYEYRLNPPGNMWLWEGVCAAKVSVIERDGFDPDTFVDTFDVISEFPSVSNVDRTGANAYQIETGLLAEFIKKTAWLFHEHLEPKYPDKFRPELENP